MGWGITLSSARGDKKGLKKLAKEWWHHFTWHIYVGPAMFFVSVLLKDYVWPFIKNVVSPGSAQAGSYLASHPLRLAGTLVLLVFLGVALKAWVVVRPILVRERQYVRMLEGIGLREFSLHDSDERRQSDWNRCIEEIHNTRPTRLCILGATGWETFGSPQSPMHSLLRDFQGSIHILLLKPDGSGFKRRTAELNRNESNYRQEIEDSIAYCKMLAKKYQKSIEVRLYEDEPIWKMVFSDRYLWLQYYDPADDVDNTPVYTLQTRDPATASSLYYPLVRVFQRRWNDSKSIDALTPERSLVLA